TVLYRIGVLAVLLLAAFLRFYALDQSSLWSDEGNTWAMLDRDFATIAQAAAADIHPPGYYWLLKLWSVLFGSSAYAMRSFSAVAGVLLVAVIALIGRRAAPGVRGRWLGLIAAFIAAVNPFQIYYSQEARMYMLLALESAVLFWALLAMSQPPTVEMNSTTQRRKDAKTQGDQSPNLTISQALVPQAVFVLAGIAGLWTHYSFPIILAAAGLAYLARWLHHRLAASPLHPLTPSLARYVILNALVLLAFLPWLPVALPAVFNWPKGGAAVTWLDGILLTLRTLLFGPLRAVPEPLWPWLLIGALLPAAGLFALRRHWSALVLGLWLLLPVGLMAVFGLFTPAFLKFLLVASAAWCLLAAAPALVTPRIWPGALAIAAFAAALAATTLPAYYAGPMVRDNYRGIAAYLAAAGDRAADLVVLNAPGQQEVWAYYDPGLPVLALPAQRPADPAQTTAALAAATADRRKVYALFWATDEADPDQVVERWLDAHAFKGLDAWQGNVRFVTYALANNLTHQPVTAPPFGGRIALVGQAQPAFPQQVAAGEPLLVQLQWQADAPVAESYAVSVQLLDSRNQVIAQHDGLPAGGARPTNQWPPGEIVADNHAVLAPFGAPPGAYRLAVALYDPATGARLLAGSADSVELGEVEVVRAPSVPIDVLPMQQRVNQDFGGVTLVGYDAYRKGSAHAPETPLAAGDLAHFTFYWQAPPTMPADWPADATMTLRLGNETLTAPLAGGSYPTAAWQPGELVRGDFDLLFDGNSRRLTLTVGERVMELGELPQ
ncbi:MAG: glycosyltransferase family 39 protein, partial [Caldilineaceae bacterium]|nr:glycosyltransferase family 39 protein [Caldilineaceae bacterium]